jgi:spore germination cell wall hydrolase CwlJ-like protein
VKYFAGVESWIRPRAEGVARAASDLSDRLGRLSQAGATRTAGAQLGVAWLLCGGLMMGAAPLASGEAHERPAERAMIALTANHDPAVAATATTEPTVLRLQDLSAEQAQAWNAANPISTSNNPAAKPFHLSTDGVLDEARALDCMTAAVYYEAAYESTDGQRAVAQVILNRMRHPAYPKTVCGVVFQGSERKTGCQFTFTCDGALKRTPSEAGWARARQVAKDALNGHVMRKVGNATHYHANYVAPYWSPNLVKVATIGAHIFYRWTGGWGQPPAFSGTYAGAETESFQIAALDRFGASTTVEVAEPASGKPAAAEAPVVIDLTPAQTTAAASAPLEIVSAADVAKDAVDIIPAEQLDWAGRPRDRGPPRIAAPSTSF